MDKDDFGLSVSLDLYYFTVTFDIKPLDWNLKFKQSLYHNDNMIYLWAGCFQFGLFW